MGNDFFEQLSIDDLIRIVEQQSAEFTSNELTGLISKITNIKNDVKSKEDEERKQIEKEKREQEEREKEAKRKEHVIKVTSMDLPLDFENIFNTDDRTQGIHADSISDGLILCLNNLGYVDIEYISSITGEDYKKVITTLKGSIYQNPDTWNECFYKGWETADEYLSGNLMRKWKSAKEASQQYDGYFRDNVKAIENVLPPTVPTKDIYITLGSPWVPTYIIDDFIEYLFGKPYINFCNISDKYIKSIRVLHDEITGTWEIRDKNRYHGSIATTKTFGTKRLNALQIMEKTLNMKSIAVMDAIQCSTNKSGTKRVFNEAETLAAIEKQNKLIKVFQDWVWKDERRKEELTIIFENKFSCVKQRNFDGSFLTFPEMSKNVELYPYQKNAVARMIFSPNTLLAHDVGAGKTYEMIAAGQEQIRMGLSKKNMYVVPNNIVGQWKSIFEKLYPNAKILVVEPKNFKQEKRETVLENIRDKDYDGIIIAYSCFEQIPISKEFYENELKDQKETINKAIESSRFTTQKLHNKLDQIKTALAELTVAIDDMYDRVYFDELGITRLFVDEAHNFKNVPIETKITNALGISTTGSAKCRNMMSKVHIVQKQNDGKGVVFATGTPITNSITDAFIMQQYLQSGELALLDLQSFDSWIAMFAEKKEEFEIDVDTSSYRLATRFSKFHNLPELTALLSSIADFYQVDKSAGIPDFDEYTDSLISKTLDLEYYLSDISQRADLVRSGSVSRTDDNMLKITTDGRKAALDLRLVKPNANYTMNSKVAHCTENVANIYFKTSLQKSTQLIFCDTSTPKSEFNIYDELKSRLVSIGVLEKDIAYIHDADTEKKRDELFKKVRNGEIRILIGSTFKLGLGVNIQDNLIALHHIDVPWRPADMTQREGRILRQGNTNSKIEIYRYITEGSFDAYSWQLLETKQRFITKLLSGSMSERSSDDIEGTILDYAEVKALAVGNPLVKQRVEVQNELNRYKILQNKLIDNRIAMENELANLPNRIDEQKLRIENCKKDIETYSAFMKERPVPTDNQKLEIYRQKRKTIRETLFKKVSSYILESKETVAMTYRGFEIILPSNMAKEKPFVWLKQNGKYYVELGKTESGILVRIDNFLDRLNGYLQNLTNELLKLEERQKGLTKELESPETFAGKIEHCKQKLNEIDKKLGVNPK